MSKLEYDDRLQKSLDRLRAMGLKYHLETLGNNEAFLFITLKSLVKLIDSKITYPTREVDIKDEYLVFHFWRGEKPSVKLSEL